VIGGIAAAPVRQAGIENRRDLLTAGHEPLYRFLLERFDLRQLRLRQPDVGANREQSIFGLACLRRWLRPLAAGLSQPFTQRLFVEPADFGQPGHPRVALGAHLGNGAGGLLAASASRRRRSKIVISRRSSSRQSDSGTSAGRPSSIE